MSDNTQPTGLIPDGLLREIHKGDCVLFLGADYPAGLPTGDMPPGRRAFTDRLAAKLVLSAVEGVTDLVEPEASPWEIAEIYEEVCGRQALIVALKEWIEETGGNEPRPIHHTIAQLPVEAIITTACDRRLERALEEAGKSPAVVVNDVDVPFVGPDKVLVLKLFGDLDQPDSLVLTDDDQRNLKSRLAPLLSVVRYLFVIKTLFFVGYDLADDLFKDLYAEVARGTGKYQRRGYAVWPGATDLDRRRWQKKGVGLVDAQPASFLSQLQAQLAQLPAAPEEEPVSLKLLDRPPYKFLDYFELEDAEIFFGREIESLLLWRKILSYRLVVLFGPSGAGKTSLLNAGVWPELARYGYRVCSVRVHTDPERAVREAVEKALPAVRRVGAALSRLRPAREDLPSYFSRALKPDDRLVVLLDQFEELFITVAPEVQERFLRDLAACLRNESWEVRFVFSLREDFLPRLEAHRDLLLQYYANSLRLEPLGRAAAELAITEPAHRVGLAYEPELVQLLLEDLEEGGSIAPPQLQIVCDRLYDHAVGAAQKASTPALVERVKSIFRIGQPAQEVRATITGEHYRQLGGAETILADYVDEVIAALPETQRDPARDVLKAMITAEETKAVLSQAEAVARSRVDLELAGPVLENLVDFRLVRRMGGEQGTLYELAHEHLIAKIRSWISPEELEAEIARRLLDQQVVRYREFGGLVDAETLERIDRQRENPYLVIASLVELELLFRSALAADYEVSYWRGRVPAAVGKVERELCDGLGSNNPDQAQKAVSGLVALASPAIVGRLGELIETDFTDAPLIWVDHLGERREVRRTALNLTTLRQRRALLALTKMALPEATELLDRWTPPGTILIPAGLFTMGSTEEWDEDPVHKVWVDAFWIDRYLVTNAQWAAFLEEGGWERRELWTEAGWEWREEERELRTKSDKWREEESHKPDEWDNEKHKRDHPVRGICWFEALAYACWAGKVLLSEAQWEKAARGTDERRYPYGDEFDKDKCNADNNRPRSGFGDTTPVGEYSPGGDSPYGVADMAGNVREWCRNLKIPYPYNAGDGREALKGAGYRVLRGGSFDIKIITARSASRYDSYPGMRSMGFGVRVGVVAAPFSPGSGS